MYFSLKKKNSIISVDDDFATLVNVSPRDELTFDFTYSANQLRAIQSSCSRVDVTVSVKSTPQKSQLSVSSKTLVANVLLQAQAAKSVAQQNASYVIAKRSSDISSKINNELTGDSTSQVLKTKLITKQAGVVKTSDLAKPVLNQSSYVLAPQVVNSISSSNIISPQRLMTSMIAKQGIDPSAIVGLTHRSITAQDAIAGTLRQEKSQEHPASDVTNLLNYHLFPNQTNDSARTTTQLSDQQGVQVLETVSDPIVRMNVPIQITRKQLGIENKNNQTVSVRFDLYDSKSGLVIETVERDVDVGKHVQLYNTPKKAPTVKVTKSFSTRFATLEIRQQDKSATSVQIYKKTLSRSSTVIEDYSLIDVLNVSGDQTKIVKVETLENSPVVYRLVPVGIGGVIGSEFTNVVVKPTRYRPSNAAALSLLLTNEGIKLEVRKIPAEVVSIAFLSRNLTVSDDAYTNVGNDVVAIDEVVRSSDYISVVDTNVRQDNVYEYALKLIYRNGTSEVCHASVLEFMKPEPGKVDTKITDLTVDSGFQPDVSFKINTTVIDTKIDIVKSILERQGSSTLFQGDIEKEREFIKSLIAHNIDRVNLSTGQRENFGVITTNEFSDNAARKNQSISSLNLGDQYRYEITPLLRTPETMLESLRKNLVDPVTKKQYSMSPSKFLQPVTLKKGVLVTQAGLRTRFVKDDMSHGAVGSPHVIDVSFEQDAAKLQDASVSRFGKTLNVVTWRVQGSIDQVDHFLIFKDNNDVRTLVGKAHSEFQYGNCQFLHGLSKRDSGTISYVVIPIFNDYKVGSEVTTNLINVGA